MAKKNGKHAEAVGEVEAPAADVAVEVEAPAEVVAAPEPKLGDKWTDGKDYFDAVGRALVGAVRFDRRGLHRDAGVMRHGRLRELTHEGLVYEYTGDDNGARVYRHM